MRYLFGSAGTRELTALLTSTPLFAFDFDGTLAPLGTARQVRAPRDDPAADHAAGEAHRVVVISGRSRADLEPRFRGVPVGGRRRQSRHRAVRRDRGGRASRGRMAAEPRQHLSHLRGVWIEDKRYSLTIDYRHAPDLQATEAGDSSRGAPPAARAPARRPPCRLQPDARRGAEQGHGAPAIHDEVQAPGRVVRRRRSHRRRRLLARPAAGDGRPRWAAARLICTVLHAGAAGNRPPADDDSRRG